MISSICASWAITPSLNSYNVCLIYSPPKHSIYSMSRETLSIKPLDCIQKIEWRSIRQWKRNESPIETKRATKELGRRRMDRSLMCTIIPRSTLSFILSDRHQIGPKNRNLPFGHVGRMYMHFRSAVLEFCFFYFVGCLSQRASLVLIEAL